MELLLDCGFDGAEENKVGWIQWKILIASWCQTENIIPMLEELRETLV